jgi:4-amino-4-deoxy-L-arabinose transferase-like glycosyltransferase
VALIGLMALSLNLVGNGRMSLWDRDEPRYAGATREMRLSGDWVHPTFNAEPRYHKPILIYWLMLAGTAVGGDGPFGARLVSALMGTGTTLMIWGWGRRVLGDRAGRIAALVLATMPLMVAESKLATTDATLTFFVVGGQIALWELARQPSRRAAALFWALLGLAVLTKSPAGPVLLAASALAGWACGGPSPSLYLSRLHWRWGLPLFAAIVVPWNVAILMRSQGEYFNVAVGFHILNRATRGLEEHGGFLGYYVVIGMGCLFPWSALLPAAIASAWSRRKETPLAGFLLGWVVGPLILLECVRTKLIHYYLPAVPAAALLVAWMLVRLDATRYDLRWWRAGRFACATVGTVGLALTVALLAASIRLLPSAMIPPALTLAALAGIGSAFGVREMVAGRVRSATRAGVAFSALSMAVLAGWLLPSAEPYRTSALVGRRLAELEASLEVSSVLSSYKPPGTIFALGHPATLVRSRRDFVEEAARAGAILVPLMPAELARLRDDPRLLTDVRETIEGFNLDKGQGESLHLTVIRPNPNRMVTRPSPVSVTR